MSVRGGSVDIVRDTTPVSLEYRCPWVRLNRQHMMNYSCHNYMSDQLTHFMETEDVDIMNLLSQITLVVEHTVSLTLSVVQSGWAVSMMEVGEKSDLNGEKACSQIDWILISSNF